MVVVLAAEACAEDGTVVCWRTAASSNLVSTALLLRTRLSVRTRQFMYARGCASVCAGVQICVD